MAKRIDGYVPKMKPAYWAEIEVFVRAALRDANPDRWSTAQPWMSAVAGLALWCWQSAGIDLTNESVFDATTISRYVASREDMSEASRGTTRSVLLRLSERLIGIQGKGSEYRRYANAKGSTPYCRQEIVSLCSYVNGQGSRFRERNGRLVLALGLGAGLHPTEMLSLLPEHVEETGGAGSNRAGFLVHVPGDRARTVPLICDYDDLLRQVLADIAEQTYRNSEASESDFLLLPERKQRGKNTVIDFFYSCNGTDLRPHTQRLRSTWFVTHLNAGTPIPSILRAAGVTGTSSFSIR